MNMKYIKILLLAAVASLAFACGKTDYPAFEYGPQDDTTGKVEVYFPKTYTYVELDPTAETYEIAIARTDATEALSVPISVIDTSGIFTVPETAEFAAGELTSTISVGIASLELEQVYSVQISFATSDNYYLYKASSAESTKISFTLEALKQKWNDAGTCTFVDYTFGEDGNPGGMAADVPIQNHEGTSDYRIVAPYHAIWDDVSAVNIVFSLDEENNLVIKNGIYHIGPETGYAMYYDSKSYPGYCNIQTDGKGTFQVNHLVYALATGSLYAGGCFVFVWDGWPGAEE